MFDFQRWRYTEFHPKLVSNFRGSQQSLSLGTIPTVVNATPYSPHGNIVCDHSCDESKRSSEKIVCHKLWSILSKLVRVCLPTRECLVYQIVPNKRMSARFESKLWADLEPFPVLPFWTRHGVETLYSCKAILFASAQYLFTHFFVWPSISWNQATVFAWDVSRPSNFSVAPAKIRDSNIFWCSSKILSLDLHWLWVHS